MKVITITESVVCSNVLCTFRSTEKRFYGDCDLEESWGRQNIELCIRLVSRSKACRQVNFLMELVPSFLSFSVNPIGPFLYTDRISALYAVLFAFIKVDLFIFFSTVRNLTPKLAREHFKGMDAATGGRWALTMFILRSYKYRNVGLNEDLRGCMFVFWIYGSNSA